MIMGVILFLVGKNLFIHFELQKEGWGFELKWFPWPYRIHI